MGRTQLTLFIDEFFNYDKYDIILWFWFMAFSIFRFIGYFCNPCHPVPCILVLVYLIIVVVFVFHVLFIKSIYFPRCDILSISF